MDFNEELDYEEGDPQSTECNDHYLQIDISEEEENLIFKETVGEDEKQVSSKEELTTNNKNDDKEKVESGEKNIETVNKSNPEKFLGAIEKNSGKAAAAVKTQREHLFDKTYNPPWKKGFKYTYYNKRNNFGRPAGFRSRFGVKHIEPKNLPEDEKKIMNSKKEARLKRFEHDNPIKGRELESNVQINKTYGNHSLFDSQNPVIKRPTGPRLYEKPNINKELLLRKKNPFDDNLQVANNVFKGAIKREGEKINGMEDNVKLFMASRAQHRPLENGEIDNSFGQPDSIFQSFRMVKNVADSRVKFVRTVSNTFCELSLRNKNYIFEKPQSEAEVVSLNSYKTFPESSENHNFSVEESSQVPSQLIGCIVKVFNCPPSTTVSDVLALCRPIGIVEEIKLNYPKEKSVVIRFADSTSAEKFFKVYHGQIINNYLLNVIVV